MTPTFAPAALIEIDDVLHEVRLRSPTGADNLSHRIEAVALAVTERPGMGRPTDRPNIFQFPINPFPYIMFYRTRADLIEIIAVRHGARDPSTMPGAPDPGDT